MSQGNSSDSSNNQDSLSGKNHCLCRVLLTYQDVCQSTSHERICQRIVGSVWVLVRDATV